MSGAMGLANPLWVHEDKTGVVFATETWERNKCVVTSFPRTRSTNTNQNWKQRNTFLQSEFVSQNWRVPLERTNPSLT